MSYLRLGPISDPIAQDNNLTTEADYGYMSHVLPRAAVCEGNSELTKGRVSTVKSGKAQGAEPRDCVLDHIQCVGLMGRKSSPQNPCLKLSEQNLIVSR